MDVRWEKMIVYQIYPRSFQDSNNDGIGDIPGIIRRLPYLKELGIHCIWLCPVYSSPNADNGYDISNYYDINPEYGTMKDMERLIASAAELNIGVIMDLVLNHTSDEHEWFVKSRHHIEEYRDYYFWRKGKRNGPPNNWTSFFGGSAWKKDDLSGEYYLHLFSEKQPDLNYANPRVREEMKQIMEFWLNKGIVGFRCDVINVIWKTSLDRGRKRLILTGREHYLSQPGNHELLQSFRKEVFSKYQCFTVGETVFVTPKMACDLCGEDAKQLDMVFSFEHMECDAFVVKWFKRKFRPGRLFQNLIKWQNGLDWNTLYFENHDQPRSVSRFIVDNKYRVRGAKALAVLLLTLRGTPFIYQGQEIGMTNGDFNTLDQIRDIESRNVYRIARKIGFTAGYSWKMITATGRDNARTPMQWRVALNAGFTLGHPWIKLNENYQTINVEAQNKDPESILSFYKSLIALRNRSAALTSGGFRKILLKGDLLVYERFLVNESNEGEVYRVAVNFSKSRLKMPPCGDVILSNYSQSQAGGWMRPFEAVIAVKYENRKA